MPRSRTHGYTPVVTTPLAPTDFQVADQIAVLVVRDRPTLRLGSATQARGLDVTVHESDVKRHGGHLSRQGPPVLRWAVFEAAESACKPASPDHAYYLQVKERHGANRAVLSVARKLLRRAHHTLRELGDDALQPVPSRESIAS
jgi:transposase